MAAKTVNRVTELCPYKVAVRAKADSIWAAPHS